MSNYESTIEDIDKSLPSLEIWYIQIFGVFIALFFTGVVIMVICGSDGRHQSKESKESLSPKKKKLRRKEII